MQAQQMVSEVEPGHSKKQADGIRGGHGDPR